MRIIALAAFGSAVLAACSGPGSDQAKTTSPRASVDTNASAATAAAASAATVIAAPASFECAAATEPDEELVCGEPQLAALDREMFRLYQVAINDPRSTPTDDALAMQQDEWIAGRKRCGADTDPKSCIARNYAERIHQLRQGSKAARDTAGGASDGPVAYRCSGLDALISASFVNVEPNMVVLEWRDESVALTQAASGSGARYTGSNADGAYSFWTKGKGAMFRRPGGKELSCAEAVIN